MDMDALVKAIAQEVLRQLENKPAKPCVRVLAARDPHLADQIIECLGDGYELFFLDEATGACEPCRYILPSLSCPAMAELATGNASKPLTAEILHLLLSGKKVEVMAFDYKIYSGTAPGPLYMLYESYAKTLESFGLREVRRIMPDTIRFWETLVTEEVVIQTQEQGASTLLVPALAIITPLAAEAAKNLDIKILKRL